MTERGGAATAGRVLRRVSVPGVVECGLLLTLLKVGLVTLGFARVLRAVERLLPPAAPFAELDPALAGTAVERTALAAAFLPGRMLCLEQSLTLYVALRRRGIPVDLRLGVQPLPFNAHAWVEHRGRPVNETSEFLQGLTPLPRFVR
jgi:hypothetical protein